MPAVFSRTLSLRSQHLLLANTNRKGYAPSTKASENAVQQDEIISLGGLHA
jgi:hypothetical protein